MPLIKSGSNEARQKNIAEMIHSGNHPIMQAVAAAYHNQREVKQHSHEKERHDHERRKYGK